MPCVEVYEYIKNTTPEKYIIFLRITTWIMLGFHRPSTTKNGMIFLNSKNNVEYT